MAARIAQLQQAHVDHVQRGAGDGPGRHAGPFHRDGSGQPPVGHVDAHAALDEFDLFAEIA